LYSVARGEILGFAEDKLMRKRSPSTSPLIKSESLGIEERPETVEEEAVEMNSTAVRGEGGLVMSAASYVKGGPLIKRKPLICALS